MMRLRKLGVAFIVGAALSSAASPVHAGEAAAQYDARSVGMAGTGAAFIQNGSAVYHNPAALQGIDTFSATATISPTKVSFSAPFVPNQSESASVPIVPFGLLGAGYRLGERVVIGAAAYATAGMGMTYEKVAALGGQDFKTAIAVIETQPAVSVKILDNLSVGAGYRIAYAYQNIVTPTLPTGPGVNGERSGWNFLGAQVGVLYRPIQPLRLALTYMTKTSTELKGDVTVNLPPPAPGVQGEMRTDYYTPHILRLGTALSLLDEKLLLALEFKAALYGDSHKDAVTTITTPVGSNATTQPLNWNNSYTWNLGAEYTIADRFPVRLGYAAFTSPTPYSTANPFALPPGVAHSFSGGAGVRLTNWDFDLGAIYTFLTADLSNPNYPAQPTPTPGHYAVLTLLGSLSATYHF